MEDFTASSSYKISFKYPSDWEVKNLPSDLRCKPDVGPKNQDSTGFSVCGASDLSVSNDAKELARGSTLIFRKNIKVDGVSAIEQSTRNVRGQIIIQLIVKNPYILSLGTTLHIFGLNTDGRYPQLDFTKTFEQMIPTIKFLDETADWKTYTSSAMDFSIKYPSNWNFKSESIAKSNQENSMATFDYSNSETTLISVQKSALLLKAAYQFFLKQKINKPVSESVAEAPNMYTSTRLPNVTVGGVSAILVNSIPTSHGKGIVNYGRSVYFTRGGFYYEIDLGSETKKDFDPNIQIFDLMLSTFKFL